MATSPQPHRKRIKHFHDPGDLHELTFSTYRRKAMLTNDTWRRWLAESSDEAGEKQHCRLVGFVFLPEPVHLLIVSGSFDRRGIPGKRQSA